MTKLDSNIIKASSASTPIYYRNPDMSAQLACKLKREEDSEESSSRIVYIGDGTKVNPRDSAEGHPSLHKRGKGGMVAIYIVAAILVVGLLIGIMICWRKSMGL